METVEFLSPEWVGLFHSIIEDGLAHTDLSGIEFSMYEVYKGVPPHLRRGGSHDLCFGFQVSGGRITFLDKPVESATIAVTADYEGLAPWVNLPLDQTKAASVIERLSAAGKIRIKGNLADRPDFMEKLDLHDRLAARTRPHVAKPNWE